MTYLTDASMSNIKQGRFDVIITHPEALLLYYTFFWIYIYMYYTCMYIIIYKYIYIYIYIHSGHRLQRTSRDWVKHIRYNQSSLYICCIRFKNAQR
jgi:hypothetical protein